MSWKKATTHTLETEIEWKYRLHTDLTLDADPCPYCGSEGFFNVGFTCSGQYAQILRPDDVGEGEYGLDDYGADKLTFAECGNCREALLDVDGEVGPEPHDPTDDDEAEDDEWREIRRSEPAESNPLVPDRCTVYEVWTRGNEELTIYSNESETRYHLIRHEYEHRSHHGVFDDYEGAKARLEERKEES